MSDEFIQDVNEELKWAKILHIWQRYKKQISSGIVVFFGLIALFIALTEYRQHQNLTWSRQIFSALKLAEQGQGNQAQSQLSDLVHRFQGDRALVAYLLKGKLMQSTHQRTVDLATYYQDCADKAVGDQGLCDALKWAFIFRTQLLDQVLVQQYLEETGKATAPFRWTAKEFTALGHYYNNTQSQGRALFASLKNDHEAPMYLRQRANLMLNHVKPE